MKKKLIVVLFAVMMLSLVAVVVLTACDTHEHHYEWGSDTTHHWKECKIDGCDEPIIEKEAHKDTTGNGKCDVCGDSVPVRVTSVSISPSPIDIRVNGSRQLTATVLPSNATNKEVTWTSSDESIATVSQDGYVRGVGVGDAVITATADGVSATCNVNVDEEYVYVQSVTLDQSVVFINVGETATLKATLTPSNATEQRLYWGTTDYSTDVVTVSNGVVTGVKEGTKTIRVHAMGDSNKYATCTVVVRPAPSADLKFTEIKEGDEVVAYSVAKYTTSGSYPGIYVIPETHNGKPVTGIDNGAFTNDKYRVTVYIPASVVNFGSSMFNTSNNRTLTIYYYGDLGEWCSIPDVSGIGRIWGSENREPNARTIYVTDKTTGEYVNLITAETLTIPEGTTSIGNSAFFWCMSLKKLFIPDSVTKIADGAFYTSTPLNTVFYGGTATDWEAIDIGSSTKNYLDSKVFFYSETQPTTEGKFWHYDTKGQPAIWA